MGIEYRPLTDSVRELNRMLMEQQAWNQEFKLQEADRGLKNMLTKSQLQTAAQQQQLAQYQIAEQERMHTPKILQMGSFPMFQQNPDFLEEFESNPEAMEQFRKTIDDEDVGYVYSPADKTWRHPISKEPARFSPYEMKFRVPGMIGIIDGTVDTVASMKQTRDGLASQLVAIDKDIAKARKSPHSKATDLTKLQRQKQMMVDQFKEADDFLSPEGLLNYYENKQKLMMMRGSFYHRLGAKDLAAQMQRNADHAAESKRVILGNILKGKTGGDGKATGDIMVYATRPMEYKGKKYAIGDSRKVRWAPGQTELLLQQGWDFSDPLAVKKREGKDVAQKPVFSTLAMTKKFADDVKEQGFMGDVTAPHGKKIRDAMDAAARKLAKDEGLGPKDDRYQIYGMVKEHFALARDNYWKQMSQIDNWETETNQAGQTFKDYLKSKYPDKNDKELLAIAKKAAEDTFHARISEYTDGKHAKFLPSKMKQRQEKLGQ